MKLPLRLASILVLVLSGLEISATLVAGTQDIRQAAVRPMREPIRVGGNVQESKLVSKVNPVFPEAAKEARVSGAVILQTAQNYTGRTLVKRNRILEVRASMTYGI